MKRVLPYGIVLASLAWLLPCAWGQEDPVPEPVPDSITQERPQQDPKLVAATVNGEPILLGAVNDTVQNALQGRPVNDATRQQLQAEVLDQLIGQKLVMQMLKKTGKAPEESVIDQAINQVRKQAESNKVDFDKAMAERGMTESQIRDQIAWQIAWGSYVKGALTDSALRDYFKAHQQQYDGTELRVRHILLRPDGAGGAAETQRLVALAEKLKEQIETGKITFEAAARKYSAGPSRHKGGDLGFIPRTGVMLENFSAAAFRLGKGETSPPVVTPYGVHLIQVTDTKPGRKLWMEARDELKAPATQALFEKVSAAARAEAKIEFTGNCPHFKPGTRELVVAENP